MAGLKDMMVAGVVRAENFERANKFYTEVLGLTPMTPPGGAPTKQGMYAAGAGTAISVYERPGMPAPQNTTLGFAIPADKFDSVVAELRSKGVAFQDIDIPEIGLKTVDGIATVDGSKSAWFTDTEGNILTIGVM
jgi:catechol 2,3-dioxygenase-like lactoylglutathione lyase family enzyme